MFILQDTIFYYSVGAIETEISHLLQSYVDAGAILCKGSETLYFGWSQSCFQDEHLRKVLLLSTGKNIFQPTRFIVPHFTAVAVSFFQNPPKNQTKF